MRLIFALAFAVLALVAPVSAQSGDTPWQASISGQIEGFRDGDGEAALQFAGEAFRTQFEGRPEAFIEAIADGGYAPIVQSRSHSFGRAQEVSDTSVLQVVNIIAEQGLYEAIYQMTDEAGEGWRVVGVVLRKQAGITI